MIWKIATIVLVVGLGIGGACTPSKAAATAKQRFVRLSISHFDNHSAVEVIKDTQSGACYMVYITYGRFDIRVPSIRDGFLAC